MKYFALLAFIVVVNSAAIDDGDSEAPATLFSSAFEYQKKFESLQEDINSKLIEVRTVVSSVLKSSSQTTLEQIEGNVNDILALDHPARLKIYALEATLCTKNLKVLINGITEFTGFPSGNCVTSFDLSLQGLLTTAYALLKEYEGSGFNVQQIVARSFIGRNAFLEAEEIEALFKDLYNKRFNEWNESAPQVDGLVENLKSNIAGYNEVLQQCYSQIQQNVAPAYDVLEGEIATCRAFDDTADPFAIFLQYDTTSRVPSTHAPTDPQTDPPTTEPSWQTDTETIETPAPTLPTPPQ